MGDTTKAKSASSKVQNSKLKLELSSNEPKEEKQSVLAQKEWNNYLVKHHVNQFQYDTYVKLAILQDVPREFVQFRIVGGQEMPYLQYEFAQKALNFAFNFDYDVEVIKSAESAGRSTKGKQFNEVALEVKFTFRMGDRTITRTIFSGHKGYENQATTKADTYKAALSKAYTVVARTFGIGSNVKGMTKKDIPVNTYHAENAQVYEQPQQAQPEPAQKSFGTNGLGQPSF